MNRYADNLPVVPEDDEIAYIVDPNTGYHEDTAWNFETAFNYIDHGYIAIAVQDAPRYPYLYRDNLDSEILTKDEVQAAFDAHRAAYVDCFGATT